MKRWLMEKEESKSRKEKNQKRLWRDEEREYLQKKTPKIKKTTKKMKERKKKKENRNKGSFIFTVLFSSNMDEITHIVSPKSDYRRLENFTIYFDDV